MMEENEEKYALAELEELHVAPSSDSPRKSIKSTAVVKFEASEAPACFAQLRCNTDLNTPPSNWLSPSCGRHLSFAPRSGTGFSSFRMAHRFPDCVGEVDVISDAENIKRLLKIPYSRAPVSLVVHRVENTLLIDDLDVHRHLLRAAEFDWRWLRTFFFEHVLSSCRNKALAVHQGLGLSREKLQERSLISKFLHYSLLQQQKNASSSSNRTTSSEQETRPTSPSHLWAKLPEAQSALPDKPHEFARNVVWTFEDIQMLIGTDMPIFGGSTHPCISLRLRDAKKPISVLTGIDYWLDNLMCNVPEVIMCYHLNGIVQKYELIKTEDLPHLTESKFSPKLIRDVAQNLLSFLKSNATKAGHTYWLFKGKDDDAVKLYDLSSLCGDDATADNPFTVPVAMLLYRVARNMKQQGSAQLGCIRTLLQNCLNLLDASKYPQIATSAHFMLSDLYIPSDINPATPQLAEDQPEENEEHLGNEEEVQGEPETSVELQSLYLAKPSDSRFQTRSIPTPASLGSSVEERCRLALRHVAHGLEILRAYDREGPEPQMAQPGQPIPMPSKEGSTVPVPTNLQHDWAMQLHALLEQKTALVLAVLAYDGASSASRIGDTLRHAQSALAVLAARHEDTSGASPPLLGLVGEKCCMLVQHWANEAPRVRKQIAAPDPDTDLVLELLSVKKGPDMLVNVWRVGTLDTMQDAYQAAITAFEMALQPRQGETCHKEAAVSLIRGLGNSHNEMALLLMKLASDQVSKDEIQFEKLMTDSQSHLDAAMKAFQSSSDSLNLAVVMANYGRLERMRASLTVPLGPQERAHYNKAISNYEQAMQLLGNRHTNQAMWDSFHWELSTTLYNLATTLQDYPPPTLDPERAEREASEALMHALHRSSVVDTPAAYLPLYQFRTASLHHRLATLHHRTLRQRNAKFALQLSRRHFERAATMLRELDERSELLRVQLERAALEEFLGEGTNGAGVKRRALHAALEEILSCETRDISKEEADLLKLLESRLLGLLLSLAKLQTKNGPDYKAMYAEALKSSRFSQEEDQQQRASRLSDLLPRLAAHLK